MKTYSENQISEIATEIIKKASGILAADHATMIALSGNLGTGKTTLVKEIAKQLGVQEDLQSPTYVIYKKYSLGTTTPPSLAEPRATSPYQGEDQHHLNSKIPTSNSPLSHY